MCAIGKFHIFENCVQGSCNKIIEMIDIECALPSFLSQKFVSTKWRRCKDILARPNLVWQGISRGCGEWDCRFLKQGFLKKYKIEIWIEKKFSKGFN